MSSSTDPMTVNPLLDFSGLPRFPEIAPEHVGPAMDRLIASARETLEIVATCTEAPRWDNVVQFLSDALDRIDRAWGQVSHLNAVVDTPELRETHKLNLPKLIAFHVDLAQDRRLFDRYRALADSAELASLDTAQRKLISNTVRDFHLSGAELSDHDKSRLKAIEEELSQLSSRFEENILDATDDYGLLVADPAKLSGLPVDVLERARKGAEEDRQPGWKLTLHAPCYFPAMQYADDRLLREALYRAYVTRGSEFGKPEWDNSALIERIVALRSKSATMLGYESYAEVSLVPKMARDPAQVLTFLRDLAARAAPFAERDVAELRLFARERLGLPQHGTSRTRRKSCARSATASPISKSRRTSRRIALQRPVSCLTCNFSEPVDGKPALFTHDEVTTLLHEFGHGLNLLLTRVDVAGVSGLEGVEWDAVELPSQFMENFCWEWDVLRHMTAHVDTGAPLPRALYDKMLAAKNFQSGMQTVRQLEFALFDMHPHHDFDARAGSPLELARAIQREVGVLPRPDEDRGLTHGFSHVFAGGYAAGYYSYKWAEVLSADAYSLFEEMGVLSPAAGSRFRDEVLAQGGSRAAVDSFIAFRGRLPQIDAFLRHNGMLTS